MQKLLFNLSKHIVFGKKIPTNSVKTSNWLRSVRSIFSINNDLPGRKKLSTARKSEITHNHMSRDRNMKALFS